VNILASGKGANPGESGKNSELWQIFLGMKKNNWIRGRGAFLLIRPLETTDNI
jgi:hypothetical protein